MLISDYYQSLFYDNKERLFSLFMFDPGTELNCQLYNATRLTVYFKCHTMMHVKARFDNIVFIMKYMCSFQSDYSFHEECISFYLFHFLFLETLQSAHDRNPMQRTGSHSQT